MIKTWIQNFYCSDAVNAINTMSLFDFEHPIEKLLPNRILPYRVLFMLLFMLVFTQACTLMGGSKPDASEMTAEAQLTATEIYQQVRDTLSVLASETALAVPASATPHQASPYPTLTETLTLIPATTTNTPLPTTEIPATVTQTPTASATEPTITPSPTIRVINNVIQFRLGGTSAFFQKSIHTREQHRYTFWAKEGQTLFLSVSSTNNDVYLDVKGLQDGQQLLWGGYQAGYWSGRLPTSQNYLISLTTSNSDTVYFLAVEIPVNIYFDPGAYSDTIEGYLNVDEFFHPNVLTRVRYLAYASAGQKMTVKLSSPNLNALSLGIVGQADGQVYLQYQVKNSQGTVNLPSTQGYYIDVYSINGDSADFTLEVTIR